ncbi:hypothetical protein M9194_10005 [Vibrio sp. S4M6]|uniref:hypothetical protein n=1 Tax=Vibrio sinus TaxID=2946865 RepID=UPI002029F68E|nr:hypothetical protein [Vibrio sinus]MCL9781759.1 hypothetical protein [Vibrio sinus]
MKKILLPIVALAAMTSTFAFAAGANDINFQVIPMGQYTNVTVSENGQALANTPVTVAGKQTSKTYTTDSNGTVYLSNITHANKQYTLKVQDSSGQTATQTTFIRAVSDAS